MWSGVTCVAAGAATLSIVGSWAINDASAAVLAEISSAALLFALSAGCAIQVIAIALFPIAAALRSARNRDPVSVAALIDGCRWIVAHSLFPIVLCYHFPRALVRGVPGAMWAFVRFLGRFAWSWLRLVHSDLRLLCLADAFLFAGLGILLGGPIFAWMLAGGAFGVLNYEVISVQFFGQHPVLFRRR